MARSLLTVFLCLIGVLAVIVYLGLAREQNFQALVTSGDQAFNRKQTSLAIESYSGALALNPKSMVAYLKRGETYLEHGDLSAAFRDLSIAIELNPDETRTHERQGDVT